jgi:osmotically-inducible protein OsmY
MASPSRRIEANDDHSSDRNEQARQESWPGEEEERGTGAVYRSARRGPQAVLSAYGHGREMTFHEDYARHGDYLGRLPDDMPESRFDEEYFVDEQEAFGTGHFGDDGDSDASRRRLAVVAARIGGGAPLSDEVSVKDSPWQRAKGALRSLFGSDAFAKMEGLRGDTLPSEPAFYRGYGPRGVRLADERLRLDICERLTDDSYVDASDMTVEVMDAKVLLRGSVATAFQRDRAERAAQAVPGVLEVEIDLRVREKPVDCA